MQTFYSLICPEMLGNTCVLTSGCLPNMFARPLDQETAMQLRLDLPKWFQILVLVASVFGFDARRASAASLSKYDDHNDGVFNYGRKGPNSSYQSGPHTRVYVTKRSWLDAGTEVLPGERKFANSMSMRFRLDTGSVVKTAIIRSIDSPSTLPRT
jgi:hypothetical protein